jgi:DNA mismatch repair protein MutS
MSMLEEYYELQIKLEKKYGELSVVLFEVGSFYEIYGVKTNRTYICKNIDEIAKILGIQLTKKDKKEQHSKSNPYLVGFPNVSLHKYLTKLVNNQYTVSVYNQKDKENSIKKDRKLDKIYSITNYIENETNENVYLSCMYLEKYKSAINNDNLYNIYISLIDLTTGHILLYEYISDIVNDQKVFDEIRRIIYSYNIKEIIVCNNKNIINDMNNIFETINNNIKTQYIDEIKEYFNLNYQCTFFNKIYKIETITDILSYLKIESTSNELRYSLIMLLQYSYEHDNSIIKNIRPPEHLYINDKLIINDNTLYQLNLVNINENGKKYNSLYDIINKTSTPMGKRYLKRILLNPITNIDELNNRYELVEKLICKYNQYQVYLTNITDIEKKYRKICLNKIQPFEFASLKISFDNIIGLFTLSLDDFPLNTSHVDKFNEFYTDFIDTFNISIMENTSLNTIKTSFFKEKGGEINELQKEIININKNTKDICVNLSNDIECDNNNLVKLEHNDRDFDYLTLTCIRYKKLLTNLKKNEETILSKYGENVIEIKEKKVKIKLTSISKNSRLLFSLENDISELIKHKYYEKINQYINQYNDTFIYIINQISIIDVFVSFAQTSKENKYIKPKIKTDVEKSFLSITNMRNAIIEKINLNNKYITNDFELGINTNGSIIFGINSVGKSSLLRSIGISIIMAQIGMFVPGELTYYPFNNLLTKININDDLFKGKSLFINNMNVLSDIIKQANHNSLILIDELCSSTEINSSIALFYASTRTLIEKNTNFIFTSHIHEIMNIDYIKQNDKLKIQHIKVTFNNNHIIFDRKLNDGSGIAQYGIEIAKTLDFDKNFIKYMVNIRNKYNITLTKTNNECILSTKKSKYNSNLYIHECVVCKNKNIDDLQTHHIHEQHLADQCGYIDHFHKNSLFNLVIICTKCHKKIHNNELKYDFSNKSIAYN